MTAGIIMPSVIAKHALSTLHWVVSGGTLYGAIHAFLSIAFGAAFSASELARKRREVSPLWAL